MTSETENECGPVQNTDRELFREREGDYYSNSVHVTTNGAIGINCGGTVFVLPISVWHDLAAENFRQSTAPRDKVQEMAAVLRHTLEAFESWAKIRGGEGMYKESMDAIRAVLSE